jgi:hypothetical protein
VVRPAWTNGRQIRAGSEVSETTKSKGSMKEPMPLTVEELEERIAPSSIGNPGNNNPPLNNTNNPGNEGTGGQVSTGS